VPREFLDVDPRTLHLLPRRWPGADPLKYAHQLKWFGRSFHGMPTVEVWRCKDGRLVVSNGVTRSVRMAKFLPGVLMTVEVTDDMPRYDVSSFPTVGDRIP
jgi:hypothetical protein